MHAAEAISGYVVEKRVSGGWGFDLYEATRRADGRQVVLKVFAPEPGAIAAARQELEALRACGHPRIPHPLELRQDSEAPVLVLDRIPGIQLASWVQAALPSATEVLEVATRAAEILEAIHAARWVHLGLSPTTLFVVPESLEVYVASFSLAVPSAAVVSRPRSQGYRATDPAFAAPEQSGRINHGCDARSDLYSLGATFYFAFTGRAPFAYDSRERLLLAHLAEAPLVPHQVEPRVPPVVSGILLKLLAKEPSERYASAASLKWDLDQLRGLRGDWPREFAPGTYEAVEKLRFPSKLYGRGPELECLESAFELARAGRVQVVFVGGAAGTGKTALVNAWTRSVVRRGGFVAQGSFHVGRDRPYLGWTEALGSFATQLLLQSNEELDSWRERLCAALGSLAGVLVEVVPDLGFVLGETAPPSRIQSREAQSRLALALERLLRVSGSAEHPLVIFLDDVHRSDDASCRVLESLIAADNLASLMIVCAFRSDALARGDAFLELLNALEERRHTARRVDLAGLDSVAARAFLRDLLGDSDPDVGELADAIQRITGNVPSVMREVLEQLQSNQVLWRDGGSWHWAANALAACSVPDSAVDLITERMDRQPEPARHVLELASCLVGAFSLTDLERIESWARGPLESALDDLLEAGILIRTHQGYAFAHERVREAAEGRLDPARRGQIHLRLGTSMLEREGDLASNPRVFELADHMNHALEVLSPDLRLALIDVNLGAGKRALQTGAARNAMRYLESAYRAFTDQDWRVLRAVGFELHLQLAESALQVADPERALAVLEQLDERDPSEIEYARIAAKRIAARSLLDGPEQVSEYGLGVLGRLGIHWPMHPSLWRARLALYRVRRLLGDRSLDGALAPARCVTSRWIAQMTVITACAAPFARTDARLAALLVTFVGREYLTVGFVSSPIATLAGLAMFSASFQKEYTLARRYVDGVSYWEQKLPDSALSIRAKVYLHTGFHPWFSSRHKCLLPLDQAATVATDIGDLEYSCYARLRCCLYRILLGQAIGATYRRLEELGERMRRIGHEFHGTLARYTTAYRHLQGAELDAQALESDLGDYDRLTLTIRCSSEPEIRTVWMLVLCVYRRFDLAYAVSEALGSRLFQVSPWVHVADHLLYRGLAVSELAKQRRRAVRRRDLRSLRAAHRWLRDWAHRGPDFLHMAVLLEAELCILGGDGEAALRAYRHAADRARQAQFRHHAALAEEQLARCLLGLGRMDDARAAAFAARDLYADWGAEAKLLELDTWIERNGI